MAEDWTNRLFAYPLLDRQRKEFRLLRVIRSPETASVECELRAFRLDPQTQTKWTALSYCWGSDPATSIIHVNGEPFSVRANLYAFLTKLSQDPSCALNEVEWVFIDAICVDQSNLAERAAQITLMGTIYHDADLVITWLGDGQGPRRTGSTQHEIMSVALGNSYWSRLWIVQEIIVAKRLVIILGQHSFTYQDALRYIERIDSRGLFGSAGKTVLDKPAYAIFFMDALRRRSYEDVGESPNSPEIETVSNQWAAARILNCKRQQSTRGQSGRGVSFHEAINIFSAQRCSVTHDKVYGLLGGVTTCDIVPDYNLSLIELYAQMLTSYLLSLGFKKDADLRSLEETLRAAEKDLHGHTVFYNLGIDPEDTAYLIVTKAVTSFFVVAQWGYILHAALLPVWLRVFQDDPNGNIEALPGRRRWYETPWQLQKRNNRDLLVVALAYAEKAEREICRMRQDDAVVTAPVGGPTYRVSEWETLIQSHCKDMWARHMGRRETGS